MRYRLQACHSSAGPVMLFCCSPYVCWLLKESIRRYLYISCKWIYSNRKRTPEKKIHWKIRKFIKVIEMSQDPLVYYILRFTPQYMTLNLNFPKRVSTRNSLFISKEIGRSLSTYTAILSLCEILHTKKLPHATA